jgi:hypothetical protein
MGQHTTSWTACFRSARTAIAWNEMESHLSILSFPIFLTRSLPERLSSLGKSSSTDDPAEGFAAELEIGQLLEPPPLPLDEDTQPPFDLRGILAA